MAISIDSRELENTSINMNPGSPFFTIFTATYNRKLLLSRAYESIKKQTFRDFEWLIIDDGSTDGTEELVKQWQAENTIPIIYKWKANGGKHTAFNEAIRMHKGFLVTALDSDDEIVPETLERYKFHWDNLPPSQKEKVGCMMCLTRDQQGNIVGDYFPVSLQMVDLMKIYLVKKIKGEKGGLITSTVFKMYPYPDNVNNVYVPEEVFQQKLSKDWKTICINEVLRIYWIDERGDHDGENMTRPKNYPGNRLLHLTYLNCSMRLFWYVPKIFFANTVLFIKLSFHLRKGINQQWKDITTVSGKILWLISLPVGYMFYLKSKK
jgi:glycosyltransferase involved in cell wall biosynthesis